MQALITPSRFTLVLLGALGLLAGSMALGQTAAARSALASADDMPLADYLGLLRQISPAAEEGAKVYLAAMEQRCGQTLRTADLRQAIARGDGDPTLMGLIRASHLRDAAARQQLVRQLRCPSREVR